MKINPLILNRYEKMDTHNYHDEESKGYSQNGDHNHQTSQQHLTEHPSDHAQNLNLRAQASVSHSDQSQNDQDSSHDARYDEPNNGGVFGDSSRNNSEDEDRQRHDGQNNNNGYDSDLNIDMDELMYGDAFKEIGIDCDGLKNFDEMRDQQDILKNQAQLLQANGDHDGN